MGGEKLYLAAAYPRRRELLRRAKELLEGLPSLDHAPSDAVVVAVRVGKLKALREAVRLVESEREARRRVSEAVGGGE